MSGPAPSILILDTTLRDGEQTQGVSFSPDEKTNIAKALLELVRVDRIEVASARVSRGELTAVTNIIDWARGQGLEGRVEVLGFIDQGRSIDWIRQAGGRVLNLLAKGSEKHCQGQLGKTLDQHAQEVRDTIRLAQDRGLAVNMYLEDWSNGYKDSPAYVFGLLEGTQTLGIVDFMLPDTLGVMSPDEVFKAMTDMIRPLSRSDVRLPSSQRLRPGHGQCHGGGAGGHQHHPLHHQLPGRAGRQCVAGGSGRGAQGQDGHAAVHRRDAHRPAQPHGGEFLWQVGGGERAHRRCRCLHADRRHPCRRRSERGALPSPRCAPSALPANVCMPWAR
jgi:hypothetical protein